MFGKRINQINNEIKNIFQILWWNNFICFWLKDDKKLEEVMITAYTKLYK